VGDALLGAELEGDEDGIALEGEEEGAFAIQTSQKMMSLYNIKNNIIHPSIHPSIHHYIYNSY
jgi:hypothetical protein